METPTRPCPLTQTENNEKEKHKIMESNGNSKKGLTASEKRFAKEMELLVSMSLNDLMNVEKARMSVGI
ncbi:MAG: hypothetical protein JKX84_09935 [Flavobacteriales bacterium]|nr:hypothetical protein [Flavobacteriales bacterium]